LASCRRFIFADFFPLSSKLRDLSFHFPYPPLGILLIPPPPLKVLFNTPYPDFLSIFSFPFSRKEPQIRSPGLMPSGSIPDSLPFIFHYWMAPPFPPTAVARVGKRLSFLRLLEPPALSQPFCPFAFQKGWCPKSVVTRRSLNPFPPFVCNIRWSVVFLPFFFFLLRTPADGVDGVDGLFSPSRTFEFMGVIFPELLRRCPPLSSTTFP